MRVFTLIVPAFLGISAVVFSTSLYAATSPWADTPGGRVRVIIDPAPLQNTATTGKPRELRGILQVDLQPGWKTYWMAPGAGGVPPQITLEDGSTAQIHFPVPVGFGEGDEAGLGYTAPVLLPLSLTLPDNASELRGNAFLGICNNICIPVQTDFKFDLSEIATSEPATPQNIAGRTLINAAFDRLPAAADASFGIKSVNRSGEDVTFELSLPDNAASVQLYVASENVEFTPPEKTDSAENNTSMAAKILGTPKATSIFYTLVQNGKAVSGKIAMN